MSDSAHTLILLLSAIAFIVGLPGFLRHVCRLCPACRKFIAPTATRCPYCTEYITPLIKLKGVLLALVVLPGIVQAQGFALMDCPDVRFFGPACEESAPVLAAPLPPPKLAPKDYPLFPKETMAPTTPPLLVDFMNRGTVESALAYLDWHDRKADVMRARQQLLNFLIKERLKGQSPLP
jgi:hypothetical protein